jgi:ABC-type multidrug transport system fused ATPase/permease subunit
LDPFEESTDDAIWRAIEHSHLKVAVSGFDKKLEHPINENGSNLR